MKKIVAAVLTFVLATMLLTACSVGKCDICGKNGIVKERSILGTSINVCTDCGG